MLVEGLVFFVFWFRVVFEDFNVYFRYWIFGYDLNGFFIQFEGTEIIYYDVEVVIRLIVIVYVVFEFRVVFQVIITFLGCV